MGKELDRPRVLTLEVQRKIVEYVSQGNFFHVACSAAGTTRQCVEYWKRLYNDGVEHAQVYADFFAALEKALPIAEVNSLAALHSDPEAWQRRAWFLERRFPKRWGNKQKVDVTTTSKGPAIVELPLKDFDAAPETTAGTTNEVSGE